MKIKNYTIWILMVIAVLVIGGKLFTNSLMHQKILDKQAVKNAELLKFSFIHQYEEFCDALEDKLRIDKISVEPYLKFKEFYKKQLEADTIKSWKIENPKKITKHSLEFFDSEKLIHYHPEIEVKSKSGSIDSIINLYKVEIPFEKLFINYTPYDFFDRIFLTDENGTVKWSNREHFGSKLIDFKKLVKNEKHTFSVTKGELILDNEPYFIYFTQVEVDGLKFNLAGLISEANFKTVGYRLDHSLATYLIFLLILILASIPIISVLSLKKGDVLTKSKVYSSGLSLLAILLFLGGFTSMILRKNNSENEKLIQTLNGKKDFDFAKDHFQKKISDVYCKISISDPFKHNNAYDHIKEIINIDYNNSFLDKVKQNDEEFPIQDSTINLENRYYVKHFKNPLCDSGKIYIGSHYSRLDGDIETVISRKIGEEIVAIIFNLSDSKKDRQKRTIDNENSILIIKEDGKVVHKSRQIKSPIDSIQQFLSEDNWLQLKYHLANNPGPTGLYNVWKIPLHLDGMDYKAFVSLIDSSNFDEPLWFIYFKNKNPEELKSTLVSVETAAYYSLYILLLLLVSFFTKIFKPSKPKYSWNSFSYGFLKPDRNNLSNYVLLVISFVLVGIIVFILMTKLNFISSFFIISINLFFISILIRLLISPNKTRSKPLHLNKYTTHKFVGFICLLALIFTLVYTLKFIQIETEKYIFLVYSLFIILISSQLLKPSLQMFFEKFLNEKISLTYSFSLFMFSWFALIGFLPGFFIAEKISEYEDHVWENQIIYEDKKAQERIIWMDDFENYRRSSFSSVSKPFYEPEVKSFISPNMDLLQEAIVQSKTKLKFGFLSVSTIFLILGLIYWLIYYLTKKLFWLDPSLQFLEKPCFDYEKLVERQGSDESCVFLCGLTTEICRSYVFNNIRKNKELLVVVDCNLFPDIEINFNSSLTQNKNEIWLIENIHCLKDQAILIEKLPFILNNARKNNITLVVSSGISWKELVSTLPDLRSRICFSEIFSSFYFDYVPIQPVPNIFEKQKLKTNDLKTTNPKSSYGIFDEGSIIEIFSNLNRTEESMNFNLYVQGYGKAYFYNIWSELSFAEKKISYFYSKEGLINFANYELVVELIQKGIFYIDKKTKMVRIFSDAFRSFVLTQASPEMLEEFKKDEKRNGNNKSIEIAIVSFIFIILALISFFDKNFLNETTTIVTGSAGLLGSLYSLIGRLFPTFQGK